MISSRHGEGAPARTADGGAPAGVEPSEVMPPVATDARATGDPTAYAAADFTVSQVVDRTVDVHAVIPESHLS